MIPSVSIVGHHDSGKTRLIARIIPILTSRGFRVGTVKLSPHLAHTDVPGTDSALHFKAGADRVLLRSETASALFWNHGVDGLSSEIDRLFVGCDIVLVEGGKRGPYPKIEVFRRAGDLRREPLAGEIDVDAVVTDERVAISDGIDTFTSRELDEIADLVELLAFGSPE